MLTTIQRPFVRQFHRFNLNTTILDNLSKKGIKSPTSIQRKAIPIIQKGKDVVIGAETGSGKTLTYLIPLIDRIRTSYPVSSEKIRRPVGLILVPGLELAEQVYQVVNEIDEQIALSTMVLTGGKYFNFSNNISLFIATPTALIKNTKSHFMRHVEMVVVDEADMLLGGSFENHVKQILMLLKKQHVEDPFSNISLRRYQETNMDHNHTPLTTTTTTSDLPSHRRQFIFAAIIPDYGRKSVADWIQRKFPDISSMQTQLLHHSLPNLSQKFIDLERMDPLTRKEALLEILQLEENKNLSTLVFANSSTSVVDIYQFLKEHDISCDMLHKKLNPKERSQVVSSFFDKKFQVLVSTDLAARGLDTTMVGHVIQVEFAKDIVSHIHRIGRTARAGTQGKVTNIISKENTFLVNQLKAAGEGTLKGGFSRKRSLSKKAKKVNKNVVV